MNNLKSEIVNHYLSLDEDSLYMRFFNHQNKISLENWFDAICLSGNDHYFLFEEQGGETVGIVHLSTGGVDKKKAEISLSIIPQYQGKGLGAQMVNKAITFAKKRGMTELHFCSMLNNLACYRLFNKCGFQTRAEYNQGLIVGSLTLGDQ